jgi:hypothetical protein
MSESKEITIAGHEFVVSQPYAEGHTLTEAEAKALNQVRAENIRNNFAAKVKAAFSGEPVKEGHPTSETIADAIATYDAAYQFTLASVGGGKRPTDPTEIEALSIARSMFSDYVKSKKTTVKAVKEKIGDDAYNSKVAEIAAREEVVKEAKRRVKARQAAAENSLGELNLDDIGGEAEAPAEAAA